MSAPPSSSPRTRLRSLVLALLAVTVPASTLPAPAAAAGPSFGVVALVAPAKVTPADAAAARKPVQERAKGLLDAGNADSAAELLADEATKNSDPVLYIDAAEAYKAAGEKNKSRVDLENGIEKARVGLDILHFLQDPRADPDWLPVDAGEVSSEISRGEKAIEAGEKAIEDLSKPVEVAKVEEEPEKKKTPRDGRGLIAGGAVFTLIGVAGLGMIGGGLAMGISAQKHVEDLNPSDPTYLDDVAADDKKGKLGNTLVYAGIPLAVVGLATGIALLVVGVKKRNKYRSEHGGGEETTTASVRLLPVVGRNHGGLVLSGRF